MVEPMGKGTPVVRAEGGLISEWVSEFFDCRNPSPKRE